MANGGLSGLSPLESISESTEKGDSLHKTYLRPVSRAFVRPISGGSSRVVPGAIEHLSSRLLQLDAEDPEFEVVVSEGVMLKLALASFCAPGVGYSAIP